MAEKNLYFDPDLHNEDTLKAFNEFIQMFELRYNANYPDPPRMSMDSALERWKMANDNKAPTLDEYDKVRAEWQSKDRVAKFLGIYCSMRFISDWKAAEPNEVTRNNRKNNYHKF